MFYSQDILQRRGGQFGIIWIAATKAVPLNRRDYAQVQVKKTCADIIQYICLEAQPTKYGKARPRFSLYLSSQLMYGVVLVFNKHHDYLLREVNDLWKRFASMATAVDIDLKSVPKADLVTMNMQVNEFVASNPEFGTLRGLQLSSPIPEIPEEEYLNFPTPRRRLLDRSKDSRESGAGEAGTSLEFSSPVPTRKRNDPFSPMLGLDHQATPEQITLIDPLPDILEEQMALGDPEQDLLPMDLHMFNEATNDPFEVHNVSPIRARDSSVSSKSVLEESISNLARVVLMPPLEQDDYVQTLFTDQDAVLPPADVTPFHPLEEVEPPQPPHKHPGGPQSPDDVTMLPSAQKRKGKKDKKRKVSFTLDLDPIPQDFVSPQKRPRNKRPINLKIDVSTQIPRETIKEHMQDGEATTRQMELVEKPIPTVNELFSRPARKGLTRKLTQQWRANAHTQSNRDADQELAQLCWSNPRVGATSSSSEHSDLELHAVESFGSLPSPLAAAGSDHDHTISPEQEQQPEPTSPGEQAPKGDFSTPGAAVGLSGLSRLGESVERGREETAGTSSLQLDASRMGMSAKGQMDSFTRSRLAGTSGNESLIRQRGETPVQDDIAEVTLGTLAEVPEDQREAVDASLSWEDASAQAYNRILQHSKRKECTFRELFPPSYTKAKDAATAFTALLGMKANKRVNISQRAPYGDIIITQADAAAR